MRHNFIAWFICSLFIISSDVFASKFTPFSPIAFGRLFSDNLIDKMNRQVEYRYVSYQGYNISFSHFRWKIDHQSVCHSYSQSINDFSACTQSAKSLFIQACKDVDFSNSREKTMYCKASFEFEPSNDSISWSSGQSDLDKAKSECNIAIIAAANDASLEKQKEKACLKYQSLK